MISKFINAKRFADDYLNSCIIDYQLCYECDRNNALRRFKDLVLEQIKEMHGETNCPIIKYMNEKLYNTNTNWGMSLDESKDFVKKVLDESLIQIDKELIKEV